MKPADTTRTEARQSVAIVGCGLIGASWAALFSAHGYSVRLWDPAPGYPDRVGRQIAAARDQLALLGDEGRGEVLYTDKLADAVGMAFWVQESAPESLELKGRLFRDLAPLVPPDAVVASSTSSFTWSQLAPFFTDSGRLITAHPFNPPHLMPLVEIYAPTEAIRRKAAALYRGLGRRPILLRRDVTGHVANRLASALWREAVHIVAAGVADVEDVDTAMIEGPGLRWSAVGPHMAYHLGGGRGGLRGYLEHLGQSQVRRWSELGSPALTHEVREALINGVEREASGRTIDSLAKQRDDLIIGTLLARRAVLEAPTRNGGEEK